MESTQKIDCTRFPSECPKKFHQSIQHQQPSRSTKVGERNWQRIRCARPLESDHC